MTYVIFYLKTWVVKEHEQDGSLYLPSLGLVIYYFHVKQLYLYWDYHPQIPLLHSPIA